MSRHIYATRAKGHQVQVHIGWDRPTQQYYLWVIRDGSGASQDIYSSIADPNAVNQGLGYFRALLAELCITVPARIFREVESDEVRDVGNRVVDWRNRLRSH